MALNPWIIIAAAALCAFVGWRGYHMGYRAAEFDQAAQRMALAEAARKLDEDRRRLSGKLAELAEQLESEANADPVVTERCLGPGRVQRLNRTR